MFLPNVVKLMMKLKEVVAKKLRRAKWSANCKLQTAEAKATVTAYSIVIKQTMGAQNYAECTSTSKSLVQDNPRYLMDSK